MRRSLGLAVLLLALTGCTHTSSSRQLSPASAIAPTPRTANLCVQGSACPTSTGTVVSSPSPAAGSFGKQRVLFQDPQGLTLEGFIFKPDGPGPFPAIVWNHGSEQNPGFEFDAIAQAFVPAGYVVMAPVREGQGLSQGQYIVDEDRHMRQQSVATANRQLVELLAGPQLDDQLAGLAYLKTLPYVDTSRIAVSGCSFGGIQTLLAAERGAGYRAAIAVSPAGMVWPVDPDLQQRLIEAADNTNIPVFIIQPPNDDSLEPGKVLGAEFQRLGKPFQLKVFPPSGNPLLDIHCFGGAKGDKIWAPDALAFIASVMGKP